MSSSTAAFEAEIAAFRAARERRLRDPNGWLALVGRYLLEPGDNELPIGVATLQPDARVRISVGPGVEATVDGQPVTTHEWAADERGPGRRLQVGSTGYEILRQGTMAAIRARSPDSPALRAFHGIDTYEPDPRFRVEATMQGPARTITITTGLGADVPYHVAGTLHFTIDGQPCTLEPVIEDDAPDRLFIMFGDATNRDSTYGAGRFLYAPLPDAEGRTVLDFNQSYNPPCALTELAACPLPTPENRLSVRIEAGEKRFDLLATS